MGIPPVSNVQASHGDVGAAPTANTQQPTRNSNSAQPADSVHLSAAAKAHMQGDTDGDGDGK